MFEIIIHLFYKENKTRSANQVHNGPFTRQCAIANNLVPIVFAITQVLPHLRQIGPTGGVAGRAELVRTEYAAVALDAETDGSPAINAVDVVKGL